MQLIHDIFLTGVADWQTGSIIAGCIWAIALGFAAGNYACSLVHRLPRGRSILERTPYCGECMTPLARKDLFPVFSALSLKHKCRYCGVSFPTTHTWTEVLIGLIFTLTFLKMNFSEAYVLLVGLGCFLVTLAAIDVNERLIEWRVALVILVIAMLYRVLADGNIYNMFSGGLYATILSALIWRKGIEKKNHIFVLPPHARLAILAGITIGGQGLVIFAAFWLVVHILCWVINAAFIGRDYIPVTVSMGTSVFLYLLYADALYADAFIG